jgi:hypothetical protein
MIQFLRKIRRNLLLEGNTGKYLKYAIGEIVLVVFGILIALSINNWNEERMTNISNLQLIDVLIADLKQKKAEFQSDLAIGQSIIEQSDFTIGRWQQDTEIDTLHLKSLLGTLAQDHWHFETYSPIYETISVSELWNELPDSLISQIDELYRGEFGLIRSSFAKQTEYAMEAKLKFLAPNRLLNLNQNTLHLQKIVSNNDEDFIVYVELFKSGVIRLTSRFRRTIPRIDQLVENLEAYKSSK